MGFTVQATGATSFYVKITHLNFRWDNFIFMSGNIRAFATRLLRSIVGKVGGVVLSQQAYRLLLNQRDRAALELASLQDSCLEPGLRGVIFSKDRALQLYTLLHTYFKLVENPVPLFIIYTASSDAHANAYREVEDALKNSQLEVTLVRETTVFRDTLLNVLAQVNTRNIFFLVDDIVFIRPVNLSLASIIDPTQCILSFRHSPHLRRSYTAAVNQPPPAFFPSQEGGELVCFNWFEQGNEWSDPWSVDGQVLSTAEVRVLSRLSDYKAPNTYEGTLKSFNGLAMGRLGMCYTESRMLNLAINRVQSEVANYSGSISADFLLDQWNNGLMLDTSVFDNHISIATHEDRSVGFVRREKLPIRKSGLMNPDLG